MVTTTAKNFKSECALKVHNNFLYALHIVYKYKFVCYTIKTGCCCFYLLASGLDGHADTF